ncbi:aldo/keto reductase [Noviherbaspirillum malthae]|jgi:diketogulonate reductase-like aldo/keto reductase|uniref:aldo/keto reductase n=1 Tax=Noviherbaspirillum malthae TaxID=1260987 RepID=UPI00188E90AE|nr:aldo/keto reductase [Noviherbaspirillum malthae]
MDFNHLSRRDAMRLIIAALGTVGSTAQAVPPAPGGNAMLSRRIPSSGEMLPVIGLGTWQTFDVGSSASDRAPLEQVLAAFVEGGGRLIDSSPMYGRSEDVAGDLTERMGLRGKLFVATKVWTQGKEAGKRQMEESMRKLRADPIDLMQVHNLVDVESHLETLNEWKRAGRVRHIGITHYTAGGQHEVARVLEKHPVDFVQINYSASEREAEQRLLPIAAERGVAVIANRPFASGELLRRLKTKALPAWAAEIDCSSWAQALLKYVVSHSAIHCAIPATANPAHVRDNVRAGYGRMPDAELRKRIVSDALK